MAASKRKCRLGSTTVRYMDRFVNSRSTTWNSKSSAILLCVLDFHLLLFTPFALLRVRRNPFPEMLTSSRRIEVIRRVRSGRAKARHVSAVYDERFLCARA
jgi:hypothetical protein